NLFIAGSSVGFSVECPAPGGKSTNVFFRSLASRVQGCASEALPGGIPAKTRFTFINGNRGIRPPARTRYESYYKLKCSRRFLLLVSFSICCLASSVSGHRVNTFCSEGHEPVTQIVSPMSK